MDAVISVAFCLVGAAIVVFAVWSLIRAWQSEHWPQAIGTVVSSRVDEYYSKGTLMYRPEISYRYSVSGREYVAGRRVFGGDAGLNWRGPAEEIVARYAPNTNVPVRYNPVKPGEAVLLPGQYRIPLFGLAFGAVFLVVGLLLW